MAVTSGLQDPTSGEWCSDGVRATKGGLIWCLLHRTSPDHPDLYERDRMATPNQIHRARNRKLPSAEEVRGLFDYNATTGVLVWKKSPRANIKAGTVAGRITTSGYRQVTINCRTYHAHRLVWLWSTGQWPKEEIDHVNGVKLDNRMQNLREASRAQNIVTEGLRKNNTSGFKGVVWESKKRLWRARIGSGSRRISLGRYKRIEDAYAAYCRAAVVMHGDFARLD